MSLQAFNGGSSTYAGESAGKFINAAFQAAPTLRMGNVKIMPNIKFKEVIQDFSAADVIDDSSCDYADGFDLNVNEVVIEPKELQSTLTLCKQTFHSDWQAKAQMMSAMDNVPQSFEQYLLGYVGGLIGSDMESLIWSGNDSATATKLQRFNGFAQILEDAGSSLPAAQDVELTGAFSADAKALLATTVAAIPARVWSNGPAGLAIYVGSTVYRAYIAQLGANNNGIQDYQTTWWGGNFQGLTYDGIPVVYSPGLDAAEETASAGKALAIATYRDNLIFGTGLMNDMNQADVIDLAKIDGSRNVRVVYRYTGGVQIGNVEDTVLVRDFKA